MQPFRFAVQTAQAPDAKAWRDRARLVESLGYSALYIPDHFGDQWGPLVALTVAAEATTSLKVGSLVFDNDFRHPVDLAKEAATLDLVSDGRLEFGLGAGWLRTDYDESGMTYDPPAVRVDRMEESLKIMKALWRDGSASFDGQHYKVTSAKGEPRPVRQPHPTIVIGGGGKRVLSIAAREADVVGVNPNLRSGRVDAETSKSSTGDKFRQRIDWIREAAGSRFDQLELQVLTFFTQVVNNRAEVVANMAPMFQVTPEEFDEIPLAMIGTVDEICDQLQRRREELGFNYIVVQDPAIDAFAPVVARLAGT
jgi:probable F420-dependent oxidoreductase